MNQPMDSAIFTNSFHSPEEHSPSIYDLTRKRKLLQYEVGNSGLPWPKHKTRDRSESNDSEPLNSKILDKGHSAELIDCRIGDGLEVQSENASNSFNGGFEVNSSTEGSPTKTTVQDHASTSSDNFYCSVVKEELEHENEMEFEDETTDDMMLYSNAVAPFFLTSGTRNLGQDARLGTRKPTIDLEFEQYFSSLML